MNVVIRDIGNSQGVIIPAATLKEAGIGRTAEMVLENNQIILRATSHPRTGWLQAIQADPPSDEPPFMDGIDDAEMLDEWVW